jgi:hypothetical protein
VNELAVPANLAAAAEREGRYRWLDTLPATISDLSRRWRLQVGQPFQPRGATAWAAPIGWPLSRREQHLSVALTRD